MSVNTATGNEIVEIAGGTGGASVGGNVASGATDSGNPVKVGGVYNSSVPTFTTGQRGDMQLDSSGNVKVTQATLISGEDQTNNVLRVEQHFAYTNINSNATTVVRSGAGFLHLINVNKKGATANIATLYDNIVGSGTVIGVIDTTDRTGPMVFDVVFSTGLTVVTATGTAADLTVSSRLG